MATTTESLETATSHPHHPLARSILVLFFWLTAAALVTGDHVVTSPRWPFLGTALTIAALLVNAAVYARFVAAGLTHALGVGTLWLVLSIAAELVVGSTSGHSWFTLLGSPDQPFMRTILLFVWIFAPALFARR